MVGTEWLVDAHGCAEARLRDRAVLEAVLARVVRELELVVVGAPAWHRFPGAGGLTALYLLSESHLACHTYPEHALATFNLYCCRARPPFAWAEVLERELSASLVSVRTFPRGEPPR